MNVRYEYNKLAYGRNGVTIRQRYCLIKIVKAQRTGSKFGKTHYTEVCGDDCLIFEMI